MMEILEMKTVTITEKGQIAIPKQIRKNKNFKEGAKVIIVAFEDRIELRPLKQISKNMFPALASEESLAEIWNTKEEDEAWKDL